MDNIENNNQSKKEGEDNISKAEMDLLLMKEKNKKMDDDKTPGEIMSTPMKRFPIMRPINTTDGGYFMSSKKRRIIGGIIVIILLVAYYFLN